MVNLKNSKIIEHMLQILINKIGRRTSESYAVVTIDAILKELESEYNFLKYVKIKNMLYYDRIDAVSIMSNIDSVEPTEFFKAIKAIIKMTVKHLDKNASFFFINEFQKAIDENVELALKENDIDLSLMKRNNMNEILKINNSEIVKHVLMALTRSLNKTFPEPQAIKKIFDLIKKLEEKYDFLKYIEMNEASDFNTIYSIRTPPTINPFINDISPNNMGEAIQELIGEVGKSIEYETNQTFLDDFKHEMADEYLSKIKEVGVKLETIQKLLLKKEHKVLIQKTLNALIEIIGRKTSKGFATVTINIIIEKLMKKHEIMKYIKIDKSRYMEGINAISIMPDIDTVDSNILGKAIQDIIKTTQENLKTKNRSFMEELKNKLGKKCISKIEDLGVNLFLLEMRSAM